MNRIRVGDLVQVIAGDAKKKRGYVKAMVRGGTRVLIQGLMMVKRHQKPSRGNTKGQVIDKESSIHISNVMPIDKVLDKAARVCFKEVTEGRERRSHKGNELIRQDKGQIAKEG